MADKASNVVLNFKMEGQVQYAKTIREINAIMNTAAKEYKNHVAAMGEDASTTEKLAAEKKKLEIQMKAAQERTKMLREQYEAMSKDTKTTTGQLTQMYSKLLDSERAEMALQKSLERVNAGLSEEAQEAGKAKDELKKLQSESKLLEAEQIQLTSSFKLQNAELGANASEAEKVELAQKQLSQQMELTDRVVKNLEHQLDRAKKVYGENSIEVMQLETKINQAKTEVSQFGHKLESLKASGNKAEQGLEGVNKILSAAVFLEVAEAVQGITDKLLELGQTGLEMGLSFGDSQAYLQANLGITADEAVNLNDVVNDVFKNGVVESVEEASQAVMFVKQSFGDLNDTQLEKLTNNITTIAKRTGTDVNENVLAAQRMMQEFGISGEEATDLIAAGFQNGLNKTGDFLDTLNEYSPHFKAAGYSADQMLQILNNGLENGAMNTDKAADAVKELQIRLGDGSIEKVIESFSKDTQKTFKEWQNGKATVADVAESISKDLNKMSPHEQQAALSELSSQFEDLGIDGAAALFNVGDAFTDVNGKADEMAQKSPGEKWESSLRELKNSLAPIGQNLIDAFTPIVEILAQVGEWFSKLPGPVQTFVTVFGGVIGVVSALIPLIFGLAAAVTALNIPLLPLIGIIAGVAAAIAGIVLVIQNWGAITDWLIEKWNQFKEWLAPFWEKVKEVFNNALEGISTFIKNSWNSIKETTSNIWNAIKDFFKNYWDELLAIFTGPIGILVKLIVDNWDKIKEITSNVWKGIKTFFTETVGNIWTTVKNKFQDIVNSVREKMNNVFEGIKEIWGNVTSFFEGINLFDMGKKIFQSLIDGIKSLHIPLPHFKVTGELDLNPVGGISLPKLSVDWYAKGAIFTRPTIFNTPYGFKGFGEAGPEAVLPLNEETLGAIGETIASTIKGGNTFNIYSRDDANAIARAVDRAYRRIAFQM